MSALWNCRVTYNSIVSCHSDTERQRFLLHRDYNYLVNIKETKVPVNEVNVQVVADL